MSAPDPIEPLQPSVGVPRQQWVGVLMYLGAAFLFALNGSVAKAQIDAGLSPAQVTEIRNLGAMLVLLVFILMTKPHSLRVQRQQWPFLFAYGLIAYAATQFLYFFTISRLPIGIGTLLAFLAPVIVALWLKFGRREDVGSTIWVSLALVLGGLALVAQVQGGQSLDPLGVAAGLLLAISLAAYLLLGEAGARRRDALSLTFWGFAIATLAWSVLAPWWNFPWPTLLAQTTFAEGAITLPVWALVLWMVTFGALVPFLLVLGALTRIGAQRGGIVGTTEPVWAALLAFLLLGQAVTFTQAIGGLVVLTGVVIAEIAAQRAHRRSVAAMA